MQAESLQEKQFAVVGRGLESDGSETDCDEKIARQLPCTCAAVVPQKKDNGKKSVAVQEECLCVIPHGGREGGRCPPTALRLCIA